MTSRHCPECGERLAFDALRCACGWGLKKREKSGREYDHRCTFRAGGIRCEYPVGLFLEGTTSGWCIFHRNAPASIGGQIVEQSRTVPYAEAIRTIQARNADSFGVRATRERMSGMRGNAGQFAQQALPEREPGEDAA